MDPQVDIVPFQKENYEDYSSGRVIYSAPGTTAFPVKLATETFERAVAMLRQKGVQGPYTVYDPFCGGAYMLTVLGMLHGRDISRCLASDIEPNLVTLADKNLSLLTSAGLVRRIGEIEGMIASFGKDSHRGALESAKRLQMAQSDLGRDIGATTFSANAISDDLAAKGVAQVDLVITDLPYGQLTEWKGETGDEDPIQAFLKNLKPVLKPTAIVCVSAHKRMPIAHEGYTRLKSLKQVQRKVFFLEQEK